MSIGLSNIQFNSLPVGVAAGGAVTGANEGLTVVGGLVQLGVPSPDNTRAISVPREIQTLQGVGATLAICTTGGSFQGNVFFYDEANGIHIDGRNPIGGDSTRYNFSYDGLTMNGVAYVQSGLTFKDAFPSGGVERGSFKIPNGTDVAVTANTGGIELNTIGGNQTFIGDIGVGYALNIGFDTALEQSMLTFQDSVQVQAYFGINIPLAGDSVVLFAPNATNPYPFYIEYTSGKVFLAGTDTNINALVLFSSNAGVTTLPHCNFRQNATVTMGTSGDFNFDGQDFKVRIAAATKTLLAGNIVAGAVTLDTANYVEVSIGGVVHKLLKST